MSATSVTGVGPGASNKPTTNELSALANGPSIIFTGIVASEDTVSSPPIATNTVSFPYALEGGADNYVVMLTTINGGAVYVSDRDEDDDDNFTGFSFVTEAECDVMYLVSKVGIKPNVA